MENLTKKEFIEEDVDSILKMKGVIEILKEKNLTIKWLAAHLGVDRGSIWRWDKGAPVKKAMREKTEELLNVKFDDSNN